MVVALAPGRSLRAFRAPTPAGQAAVPRFETAGRIKTSAKEASDAVGLPDGRFVVVSDTSDKVRVVDARGRETAFDLPKLKAGNSQLEGVAFDPKRNHLFVVREEKGVILRYEWNPASGKPPKFEKRFKVDLKDAQWGNKGFEGLTFLSAQHSPTGEPQLLAAKEGKPRRFYMFDDGGGGKAHEIKMDQAVRDVAKDFSALTVDPKTGHLWLASDESSVVVQVKLVKHEGGFRGELVQAIPLKDSKGKPLGRIEGLAFNPQGDLHVLTENDGVLHVLKRLGR